MIAHPVSLAILFLDLLTLLSEGFAVWVASQVFIGWQPDAAHRRQLRLERRAEAAGLLCRAAYALFFLSSIIYVAAIAQLFPGLVPGAMCGTGVVQAMGSIGERSMAMRAAVMVLLHLQTTGLTLDADAETAPLTPSISRLTLLLSPILFLAVKDTTQALVSMNTTLPVSCCAALLDTVAGKTPTLWTSLSDDTLTSVTYLFGGLLGGATIALYVSDKLRSAPVVLVSLAALFFVPSATLGLIRVFSAYHYEVLSHHCPWCLFLSAHRLVGYPLFGALLLITLESTVVLYCHFVSPTLVSLNPRRLARSRLAALRVLVALLVFGLLIGVPALWWRIRYGVWLSGG